MTVRVAWPTASADALSDKECLSLLDAKVDSMDDLDRLGFEKQVLGAGICDQESIGDKVCLSFLDKKIASMSSKERLQTWQLACAYDMFGPSEPPTNTTGYSGSNVKPDRSSASTNTTALKKQVSSPAEATLLAAAHAESAAAAADASVEQDLAAPQPSAGALLGAVAVGAVAVGAVVGHIAQRRNRQGYVPVGAPRWLPI